MHPHHHASCPMPSSSHLRAIFLTACGCVAAGKPSGAFAKKVARRRNRQHPAGRRRLCQKQWARVHRVAWVAGAAEAEPSRKVGEGGGGGRWGWSGNLDRGARDGLTGRGRQQRLAAQGRRGGGKAHGRRGRQSWRDERGAFFCAVSYLLWLRPARCMGNHLTAPTEHTVCSCACVAVCCSVRLTILTVPRPLLVPPTEVYVDGLLAFESRHS